MGASLSLVHLVATDSFAGTERYVSQVCGELADRGHRVVVIGGSSTLMRDACGGNVTWVPGSTARQAWRALSRIDRPDVVHAHLTSAEAAAAMAKLKSRSRLVVTRHIAARRGSSRLGALAAPFIRHSVDLQLAISQFVADRVDGSSQILTNGVPSQELRARDRGGPVLLCQRLEREKDGATALRAWAASGLWDSGRRLRIAGEGSERSAMESLANALGVRSSVDFLGFVVDVQSEMLTAGALLATAPAEPLGLTVLEAMALGLPVIACEGGGHVETVGVVDRQWLFPSGDHAACAALLDRLDESDANLDAYSDRLLTAQRELFELQDHVDRLVGLYAG